MYLETFAKLSAVQIECDQTQDLIDRARYIADGYGHLELDRKQTKLDNQRKLIQAIIEDIAINN